MLTYILEILIQIQIQAMSDNSIAPRVSIQVQGDNLARSLSQINCQQARDR